MIVDVDAFAVQNAFEINYDVDPQQVVALVNMGAGVTTINILSRGSTVFWRDMSVGGNQFTEALQREYSLSFEQAERLKRGESVQGCSPSEAQAVLEAVATELAAEIHKTFDFFAATSADDRVTRLAKHFVHQWLDMQLLEFRSVPRDLESLKQAMQREPLHRLLTELVDVADGLPQARRVRWSLDVDPVDLY